jgi:hypothetical protein
MGQKHRAKLEMTKQLVAQHPLSLPEPPGHLGNLRRAENQPSARGSSRMGELQKSEQERSRKRRGFESMLRSGEGRKGIKRYT